MIVTGGAQASAGVGFSVPIDEAKSVAQTLIAGGTVEHAYLGVTITSAAGGAKVACVVDNGPASSAGLKQGYVITKFDGKTITSADTLTAAVTQAKAGEKVTVTVRQNGSTKQISVTLGKQPSSVSNNNCSK